MCNANFVFRDKVGTVQIPILEEAVQECLRLNLTMFIDVKGNATKVLNHNAALKLLKGIAKLQLFAFTSYAES